jgi:hypothetical protein
MWMSASARRKGECEMSQKKELRMNSPEERMNSPEERMTSPEECRRSLRHAASSAEVTLVGVN